MPTVQTMILLSNLKSEFGVCIDDKIPLSIVKGLHWLWVMWCIAEVVMEHI